MDEMGVNFALTITSPLSGLSTLTPTHIYIRIVPDVQYVYIPDERRFGTGTGTATAT